MTSSKKTLLVEQISYAEEALENLKGELYEFFKDIELEYEKVFEELNKLEESEEDVKEETFDRVNQIIQDAWTTTMSARNCLQYLDETLHKLDDTMCEALAVLGKEFDVEPPLRTSPEKDKSS